MACGQRSQYRRWSSQNGECITRKSRTPQAGQALTAASSQLSSAIDSPKPANGCVHLLGRLQGTWCLEKPSCRPGPVQRLVISRSAVFAQPCRLTIALIQIGAKGD